MTTETRRPFDDASRFSNMLNNLNPPGAEKSPVSKPKSRIKEGLENLGHQDYLTPFELLFIGGNYSSDMISLMNKATLKSGTNILRGLLTPNIFTRYKNSITRNPDDKNKLLKHVKEAREKANRKVVKGNFSIFSQQSLLSLTEQGVIVSIELSPLDENYSTPPEWNIHLLKEVDSNVDNSDNYFNILSVNVRYSNFFYLDKSQKGLVILKFKTVRSKQTPTTN